VDDRFSLYLLFGLEGLYVTDEKWFAGGESNVFASPEIMKMIIV